MADGRRDSLEVPSCLVANRWGRGSASPGGLPAAAAHRSRRRWDARGGKRRNGVESRYGVRERGGARMEAPGGWTGSAMDTNH